MALIVARSRGRCPGSRGAQRSRGDVEGALDAGGTARRDNRPGGHGVAGVAGPGGESGSQIGYSQDGAPD